MPTVNITTQTITHAYHGKHAQPKTWSVRKLAVPLTIIGLMVTVTAISFFMLQHQSLRLDEAQSLWQSSNSPKTILYVIAQDVHVPLYGLLLHFWMIAFGNNVARTRLLSFIMFLACIPFMYRLGRAAFPKSVALFATILLALSPFLNWYANETRMYTLMVLATVINQYYFLKILKLKEASSQLPYSEYKEKMLGWWWGYGLSALLGIYSHYFFWLVLGTQGLFYLFNRKKFPNGTLSNFILILVLLLLAISPWLYYVKTLGMIGNSEPLLVKPTSIDVFNTFSQFIFGFQDDHINTILVSLWPLAVLFAFLSLRKKIKIPLEATYFFLSALIPILAAFAVSITFRPVFLARYLILATPSLYLFLAWFLSTFTPRISRLMKAGMLAIVLLTFAQQTVAADTPVKEDYRDAASYIGQQVGPQDIVVLSAPFTIYPFDYYYRGPAAVTTLPVWDRYKVGPIPPFSQAELLNDLEQIKSDHSKLYILFSYDQGYQNNIRMYLETHFQRLEEKQFSPGMTLDVYQLRYDNVTIGSQATAEK